MSASSLSFKDPEARNYLNEHVIHQLICPVRSSSDELEYDDHNLWILDDRLAFYTFFQSDKPFKTFLDSSDKPELSELLTRCEHIASASNVLAAFEDELRRCGVAGDLAPYKLTFLASFTRLYKKPVSVCFKGGSAAGKSHVLQTVLGYLPQAAYVEFSGFSDKYLQHSKEDFRHRHIVIHEFAGLQSSNGNKWLRMLLSEGFLKYASTTTHPQRGFEGKEKVKEGPTGCFLTTTETELHLEDETRLLSMTISGGPEQAKAVLLAQARSVNSESPCEPDKVSWHAFHDWLVSGPIRVVIPYSEHLAGMVDHSTDRIKRDFPQLLNLTAAHALLHRLTLVKLTLACPNANETALGVIPAASALEPRREARSGCHRASLVHELSADPCTLALNWERSHQTSPPPKNLFLSPIRTLSP